MYGQYGMQAGACERLQPSMVQHLFSLPECSGVPITMQQAAV